MIFEVYYHEKDSDIRVTLFEIEIYTHLRDGVIVTSHPFLGNFLTYFHEQCKCDGFNKESFVRDSDIMNCIQGELFSLFQQKAPFNKILDRLERIINRYAEKYGFEVNVD